MTFLTYLRHRLTVALAIFLLAVICVESTGAIGGWDHRSSTHHKCCVCKLFLKLDQRYQVKPAVLLSTFYIEPVVLPVRRVCRTLLVSRPLTVPVIRSACLRGPPCA